MSNYQECPACGQINRLYETEEDVVCCECCETKFSGWHQVYSLNLEIKSMVIPDKNTKP